MAVGKSTFARILRALLSRWPAHPRVDLVTTDGFLLPNACSKQRGLLQRKGFPESYDVRRLVQFMADVKAAEGAVHAPVYSHQAYDIVPGEFQVVDRPDIVIVEGLNVLQTGDGRASRPARVFVSDFFDFSIYIDADEADIERWYVARFLALRETVFRDPRSYFHRYAALDDERGRGDGARDLADDQRREPAREHPAHARARAAGARKGRRPRRPARPAEADLRTARLASSRAGAAALGLAGLPALVVGFEQQRRHRHAAAVAVDRDEGQVGQARHAGARRFRCPPKTPRPRLRATS